MVTSMLPTGTQASLLRSSGRWRWQIPTLVALGGSLLAACSSGSKGGTGPGPGIAAGLEVLTQPGATSAARATLTPAPVVQIIDSKGDPVDTAGITVTAALASGSTGSLTGTSSVVTDVSGRATFSNLAIAGLIGTKALRFTASGLVAVNSSSLSLTAGAVTSLVANSSTSQNGLLNTAVTTKPSVRATDADGNGVIGRSVTFAVTAGGGSGTGLTQTTNGSGVATVGNWTLGPAAGLNTMTATSAGLGGSPVTFNATGGTTVSNFTIQLQYLTAASPANQAVFNLAKSRWEQAITGDLGAVTANLNTGTCGNQTINTTINDVLIFVELDSIDGPGQILGQAGPCFIRNGGAAANLTTIGIMTFDTFDLAGLAAQGELNDVILHEMGHVLGFGTLWNNPFPVANAGLTQFIGANALAAYTGSNGGTGAFVPIEDNGGAGTAGSHWEESIFQSEVMTGFITGTVRPFSLTTIQSMADMGYVVNPAAADAFNINTQPTIRTGQVPMLRPFGDDIRKGPIQYMDPNTGRVTGYFRH